MAQRQFRTDDTSLWADRYGTQKDGSLTVSGNSTQSVANAGCSGTSGGSTLTLDAASTFADGDLILIHQSRGTTGGGAGIWELNKISSGGGTTTLTLAYTLINTYTDSGSDQAQVLELKEYSDVTINSSVTYSAPAWDGNKGGILALLANGPIAVTGTLSASSLGFRGGAMSSAQGGTGEGTGGASSSTSAANGNGGGGGVRTPQDHGNSGAGGGHVNSGGTGPQHNEFSLDSGSLATGGGTAGSASLVTMVFGGAGGAGGHDSGGGSTAPVGGDGGGIVFLIGKTITVTGSIVTAGDQGGYHNQNHNGGGGGGAGGSVLIKGQTVTLGSTLVTATNGAGNWGCDTQHSNFSGAGSVGRIHCDYSQNLSGTTSPALDSSQDFVLNDLPSNDNYTLLM